MDDRQTTAIALREELVDRLVSTGRVRSPAVERALRSVPRERFVPDLGVLAVYDDRAQLVKEDAGGTLSTISQPTMVAVMLELAQLSPGDRVLEVGTGTGYNAALLGELVGPEGHVVSIDVEEDLVGGAASVLVELGVSNVEVHVGDGRDGWPDDAPYDCVMATVGVPSVPPAWRVQTADGGVLLAPLLDSHTLHVERRDGDAWTLEATSPASFIPLR